MKLSPKQRLERAHDRGFASGVALACGILRSSFGEGVTIEEILGATNLNSRSKLRRAGAQQYDIDLIFPPQSALEAT